MVSPQARLAFDLYGTAEIDAAATEAPAEPVVRRNDGTMEGESKPFIVPDIALEMAAYERLPPIDKDKLNNGPFKYSALQLELIRKRNPGFELP